MLEVQRQLASAEEEDADLPDDLAKLEDISSRMLRREMQALGVFDQLPAADEVAQAEPSFVWEGAPVVEQVDWNAVLNPGGTPSPFEVEDVR